MVAEPAPPDDDVAEEQAFLDRAYEGLASMREEASAMLHSVLDLGRGGTFQSRTERDIVVRTSLARLAQLDVGDEALCFGRIDRLTDGPSGTLEAFHIGRVAVSGPDREPLVVDWRAPVAEPFYRATGLDPLGLARRRHLAVEGRKVVGVEDEYFAQPEAGGASARALKAQVTGDGLVLGGPAALLSALSSARTGHMGDIVATIQGEQDQIIRAPLAGVLMVQGGPGTGKTAVALHRAAYLLYTHRFPLERQGVLVVGPNPLFLRYIEQVLPSLGETGVTLSTATGLVPEIEVRAEEDEAVAALKGEARMARLLAQAVRTRERPLRHDTAIPYGTTVLRLSVADSKAVVAAARRRRGTHNARRRFVETLVLRRLAERHGLLAEGAEDGELGELGRRLRANPAYAEALERMWPRLEPHELLHDLFGAPPLLRAAGRGLFSDDELALLHRPRSPSLGEVGWTAADAALVDEARSLLGPRRPRRLRREASGRSGAEAGLFGPGAEGARGAEGAEEGPRAYGHIVVDEVQGLSPMQLRMVARRSLSGSMTVVGDIAQATGPSASADWASIARHLAPGREARQVELTVSYRTPAEIVELAERVRAAVAPGLAPPRPVRREGVDPRLVPAARGELAATVATVAAEEVAAVAPGTVAVIAPAVLVPRLRSALSHQGLEAVDPREPGPGLSAPVVVLPPEASHGLEFDAVVVVEPAVVAAGSEGGEERALTPTPRGLRALYVALTRATRRLALVHALALPDLLEDPSGPSAAVPEDPGS